MNWEKLAFGLGLEAKRILEDNHKAIKNNEASEASVTINLTASQVLESLAKCIKFALMKDEA
jgi:hypothetical protein